MNPKKYIDKDLIVKQFQELEKSKPMFKIVDAMFAGCWSTLIASRMRLKFNEVRKLAGLPVAREKAIYRRRTAEEKEEDNYMSSVAPKKAKGPLVNQCLRMFDGGNSGPDWQCPVKLPKGEYFCSECRSWKNSQ